MRNLKRALSLTLASVMLLGMMVVGSSAASYPDVEDTHNVEAIEVLQAIKVMVGDDNGNFGPDDQVNRAQMAVVMALLLDLDYDYYKGTNPFWDVPSWAEPYVAACYANGIVSGYNATTYGSGDPVTAVQAASMMMRALGYFQYQSDYKDGFELSTVKQASKIGLLKDVNAASNSTALTRNQVAQLALNTLETAMVDAKDNTLNISGESGGMSMSVTGGQVDYIVRTSQEKFAQAINKTDKGGTETDGRTGNTVELGEQLFQGDLIRTDSKNDSVSDDFGRPAVTWKLHNTEIGTYEDNSDLVQTWTTKVTKDAMYKAMSKNTVDAIKAGNGTLAYWVDGVYTDQTANIAQFADRNNTGKINNDKPDTGNGTVTKLYVDEDDNATIVVVNTYVYQATSDYNSTTGEVRIGAAGDTNDFGINLDNYTLKGDDFNVQNVKEDDYLLITAYKNSGSYKVATVKPAEIVTGEVTGYKLEDNITVDEQDYSYSLKTNKDGGVKSEIQATGSQVALVLDEYGYVIAVDTTLVGGNYVFISQAAQEGNLNASNVIATAYFADGTNDTITLKRVAGSTVKSDMKGAQGWYTYSKDSDNKYTLTAISGSYTTDKVFDAVNKVDADKVLVQGNAKLADITAAATGIRSNNKTQFIVVDKDGDVYTYTGTSAAPNISMTGGNYDAGYVWNKSNSYATYVFISLDGNTASEVDSGTEDDVFYFVLEKDATKGTGDDTYYIYNAIVNGAKTKIETDDWYTEYTLYSKIKRDSKTDRITSMKEVIGTGDTNNQYASFTTDDDWKKFVIEDTATRVEAKNGGLSIGGRSYVTTNDSQLNLIVRKGASATTDKDAKYELVYSNSATAISSKLLGYDMYNGYYYIVTKDAYKNGAGNTELKYLFLYVSGDTDANANDVASAKTKIQAIPELPAPTAADANNYTVDEIKAELKKLIEAAAGGNVKVELTWGDISAAHDAVKGSAVVTVKVTSKNDPTKTETFSVTVPVDFYVAPKTVAGDLGAGLGSNFNAPTFKDKNGKDITSAKAGDEIQIIITDKENGRSRVAPTKFEVGNWYDVTINDAENPETVKCTTAGQVVVTYTLEAGDLSEDESKFEITISDIAAAEEPEPTVTIDSTDVDASQPLNAITGTLTAEVANGTNASYSWMMAKDSGEAAALKITTKTLDLSKVAITGTGAYRFGVMAIVDGVPVSSEDTFDLTVTAAEYAVTGIKDATITDSTATAKTFSIAPAAATYAADDTATLNITLAENVPVNRKVTVTITTPAGIEPVVIEAGSKTGSATFTMGKAAVTVAATAKEEAATVGKNTLGEIATTSNAAGVSIKKIEVKDSKNAAVAKDAEMAAGDYTLVVTPNTAAKTTAKVTITLSGVTAKSKTNAEIASAPSWGSTAATETVVTIDAGSAVAGANTITYTFTVAAAGSSNKTITPVITVATEGAIAKLEAGVSFTGTPTWAENDTVTFTSTGGKTDLNVVATMGDDGTTWTCTGAPNGYTAAFDGTKLTLTATSKADVTDSPFGTISAAVSNAADSSLKTGTVATPDWTPGVAQTAAAGK